MIEDLEHKSELVKRHIEKDFQTLNDRKIEDMFDRFQRDRSTRDFIEYYNRTVLEKEKMNFSTFRRQWAIQEMTRESYGDFDKNFGKWREEILRDKDIESFYRDHCCRYRREGSFCSKLFHTLLPDEFPPVDSNIRKEFGLLKEEVIDSVIIIREGYNRFISEHADKIEKIRKVISAEEKFLYLRINELSDIRILDMYYWIKS